MLKLQSERASPLTDMAKALIAKIRSGEVLVGVIGLGYVGLPLSIAFGEAGTRVLGFDTDPSKSRLIAAGKSYIRHIPDERIGALVEQGMFAATDKMDRLSEPDAILICVPTAVYYPVPMHMQAPYRRYAVGGLDITEAKAETVISLPMHAYLDEPTQDAIIQVIQDFAAHRPRSP